MLGWTLCFALAANGPSHEGLEAVRAVLARPEGAQPAADEALVRRLVALGPSSTPALFALVTGEDVEELLAEGAAPSAWLCEPDRVGELALAALARLPSGAVLEHLRAREAAQPERDVRVAEVRVLASLGSAQTLEFLFQLVDAFREEIALRPVRDPVKSALIAILRADKQGFRTLEKRLASAPLEHQRLACEALTATGQAAAAGLLAGLLGRDLELDLVALEGLTELEFRYPWRMHDDVPARLRPGLGASDARARAAAAQALGKLRDGSALPALIAHIDDPDRAVARASLWAVRELSGHRDLSATEDCQRWFEGERAWWKDQGLAVLQSIQGPNPTALVEGLRTLLAHPLGNARVADALVAELPELAPQAQILACRTLAQLDSRSAVPALIDLLSSTEKDVRQAAWEALRTITDQDLPLEPRLWEEYAFG